jgi:ribosomal protein L11 methyltransferase
LAAHVAPAGTAVVRGYLPAADMAAARAAVEQARRNLGHLQAFGLRPIGELATRIVQEEDWADAWRAHFPVLRVGRRLVVKPTWQRHRARPGDVVIELDPGMAFGTGLHPTTRLCLAGLDEWADEGVLDGSRLLDFGSGSGILSVAAGLLGASAVLAIDTDPIAVEATRANVALNGLDTIVVARQASLPLAGDEGSFPLVVANLVAPLLVDLAAELAHVVGPGGRLITSGIFIDRGEEVASALAAAGFSQVARQQEGDWLALEFQRWA